MTHKEKIMKTLIARYGSMEAYKAFCRIKGAEGGATPTKRPKGFAVHPELARKYGLINGKARRKY